MVTYSNRGFTLLEVLIALAILTIALTALLKITSENITQTRRIKDKTIANLVMTQGISLIQLGIIKLNNESLQKTYITKLFGETWYWRIKATQTPIKKMQIIRISASLSPSRKFNESCMGYIYSRH